MQVNKSACDDAKFVATATGPTIPENKTAGNVQDAGSDEGVPATTDTAQSTKAKKASKGAAATRHQRSEAVTILPTVPTAKAVQPQNGRMAVTDLRVHEINAKIYGEKESITDLEKSVRKYGILDPLLITWDGRIISGHRRYRTALKLEITDVPVRIFESRDELEIKTAVLEHNRHRVKNRTQLAAEADMMLEIESELAARRKKVAAKKGEVEILPLQKKGKARDAVGEKLGMSGRSVDKAAKTSKAIGTLKADGKEAEAAEVEAALNKGYDTGYKAAVEKGLITATKPKTVKKEKAATKSKKEAASPPVSPAPSVPPKKTEKPAAKGLDSDTALERADEVLTFLRGLKKAGEELTKPQRKNWERLFDDLDECRADLSL